MEISWDFAEIFSDQEPVSSEETKNIGKSTTLVCHSFSSSRDRQL